ncbi:CHAT domain-containing protein [Prochlorothrix hollandica]|uniref:CHAT domain-containing protein n=1 Tax=Prochlorothrix hollandica TaxID=1223 RepID=UPI0003494D46|nr:CHAT domain-containing protein [Prochlorothrix hollandica]
MDEARVQAYLELIQELLSCPGGQEAAVLTQRRELVDGGLVAMMGQVAEMLRREGRPNADWLEQMAGQVAQRLGMPSPPQPPSPRMGEGGEEGYQRFFVGLLQTSQEDWGQQEPVWRYLSQNLQYLNLNLIPVMEQGVGQFIAANPESALGFMGLLENVVIDLKDFPLGNRADNLEIAIAGYQLVLRVRTRQQTPELWAQTQNNLAIAYGDRIRGDRADNLERAIAAYTLALEIYTREDFPQDWAMTQNNLANAYYARIRGDRADNLEQAIAGYRAALDIRTPTTNPLDCLQTGCNLGKLGFTLGKEVIDDQTGWALALEGYQVAMEAVEQSRAWATDDRRRQEILENAIGVYANALQCHIELKQYDQAILLTERARSRHLVELMATADLYDKTAIPEPLATYLQQYEDLQGQINRLQNPPQDSGNLASSGSSLRPETLRVVKSRSEKLQDLQARKIDLWQQIRRLDPILAGEQEVSPLSWPELTHLLADLPTTALVSFYSTNDHTHLLILRKPIPGGEPEADQNPDSPLAPGDLGGWACTVHTCKNQGYQQLQTWLRDQWLIPYQNAMNAYGRKDQQPFQEWQNTMADRLQELADRLDLNTLIHQHLQGIDELILIPHIFLHLIPFAALPLSPSASPLPESASPLPEGEGPGVREYLGDRFRLRILPSANILKYCHDRQNSPSAPLVPFSAYGSVEGAGDPSTDPAMAIARSLFEPIAQHFGIPDQHRLLDLKATRDRYHALITNPQIQAVHSIHHASAQLDNPLNSALYLADGTITLGQLLSYQWRMPQIQDIFLAACETNLGNPNISDDILTLGSGFLCAGARSVVSTLWSVDAIATTLFCQFYYYERQLGRDRPTALHNAQGELRRQTNEQVATYLQKTIKSLRNPLKLAYEDWRKQPIPRPESHPYRVINAILSTLDTKASRLSKNPADFQPFASPYYWSAFILQGLR